MNSDKTSTTDQIFDKIVELIHAAMERKHGPTVGYGVGKSCNFQSGPTDTWEHISQPASRVVEKLAKERTEK